MAGDPVIRAYRANENIQETALNSPSLLAVISYIHKKALSSSERCDVNAAENKTSSPFNYIFVTVPVFHVTNASDSRRTTHSYD